MRAINLIWPDVTPSQFMDVYGRPNRPFLKGKGIAAVVMLATVTTLFVSLVIGALGVEVVKRYAPGFAGSNVAAYVLSIAVSLLGVFVFVLAIYRVLTNAPVTVRDVLPGALMAAILLEASFQIVPVFVRFAGVNPVLRVLGGPVILLLWLYLMANIIVLGAELNWWQSERREVRTDTRMLE